MHHSPPQMLNSYLIKGERASLSSRLFYEHRSWYIANQSGSAKETVSPNWREYWDATCFVCRGNKTGFDWYQSSLSNHDESTEKLNIKIEYKYIQSNILLYQLLIFLNLFIKYLFRQRDCKKKVSTHRRLVTIFYFTRPVDRKQTTF